MFDFRYGSYLVEYHCIEERGLGKAIHVQAYRISSLVRGSLFLILADILPWSSVFWITAAFMATTLSTPLGFSMTQIGLVAKHAALWPGVFGGLVGGLRMVNIGINRVPWVFGVVQAVSISRFALLANSGPMLWMLAAVIGFEYLGVGSLRDQLRGFPMYPEPKFSDHMPFVVKYA